MSDNALYIDYLTCHLPLIYQERPGVQNGVVARCMKMDQDSPSQTPVERISDIYNIQRLKVIPRKARFINLSEFTCYI